MSDIEALAAMIRDSRGVAHKRDIAGVVASLGIGGDSVIPVGDDTAAIPDGDGHLLFAIEGFVADFVAADPYFAGYCGVLVNVSDIAAMGGWPIAVVDAIWSNGDAMAGALLAGLRDAARCYGVPIVGGHSNLRAADGQLAVAIVGRAGPVITSFGASPGDILVVATDLRGRFRDPYPWWDASSGTDAARLRDDLAILPSLAREGLVHAGKDISMAGVVGTAMMMLEASGCGGALDLSRLPRPHGVTLERWLTAFPSFGFIFAVDRAAVDQVIGRFSARDIACAAVGTVNAGHRVTVGDGIDTAQIWDFAEPFIGCVAAHRPSTRETNDA
jgi:uncharacterized protein